MPVEPAARPGASGGTGTAGETQSQPGQPQPAGDDQPIADQQPAADPPGQQRPSGTSFADLRADQAAASGDSATGSARAPADAAATATAHGDARQAAPLGAMNQAPSLRNEQSTSPPSAAAPTAAPPSGAELVKRQGNNWALPRSLAGAYGNKIVRSIRVECYPDRFVLLPSAGSGATEVFGFSDGQVNRATLQLATAVRDRVQRWGAAIPGGRWQPRLEVDVKRRGEARFHQLRTLMHGSGVEVTERTIR